MKRRLLIFASGTATGGGSGFDALCIHEKNGDMKHTRIIGVVSNHEHGGVRAKAEKHGIPFYYFPGPYTAENYREFVRKTDAEFVALSGWLKLVTGLDPARTFNIHPGDLPDYGGPGMYGHYVHEKVFDDFKKGLITHSAVTMHWVTESNGDKNAYDKGPWLFKFRVKLLPEDTAETIAARVNKVEHEWQYKITDRILSGKIHWDGKDPERVYGREEYMDAA